MKPRFEEKSCQKLSQLFDVNFQKGKEFNFLFAR